MAFYSDSTIPSQQQFSMAPASLCTNNTCYFPFYVLNDGQPDMCEVVSLCHSFLPTCCFSASSLLFVCGWINQT